MSLLALAAGTAFAVLGCQSKELQEGFAPPTAEATDSTTITLSAPTASAVVIQGLTLSPTSASLAPGASITFTPVGWLAGGGPPVVASVTWVATGGTITSGGVYTAGTTAGSYEVTASSTTSWNTETAQITISGSGSGPTPVITRLNQSPGSVTLAKGATQQFTASADLSDGSQQAAPTVTWWTSSGSISAGGLYKAPNRSGSFTVIGRTTNGLKDTSSVTVTSSTATVTGITLTPSSATLNAGATQQFTVSATLSNGTTQANPATTWSATGGTVTSGGQYTAGSLAGSYRVIASSNGKADTSTVTVTNSTATITGITLTPATSALNTGATQQFTASATLSNGTTQANPAVTWSATGGSVSSGLYSAGNSAGAYRVIAISSNGTADTSTVTITVTPPPPPPPPPGPNGMYFNSSEAGCGTDSNILLCDDFEDGTWYEKNCDQANGSGGLLQTDGWCGTIYNNAGLAAGTGRCGNVGVRSNCAATTGVKGTPGFSSTTGNMADHDLAGGGAPEVWVRFYTKPMGGYTFGQEKWLTFNASGAGSGGIRWGNLMWNCGGNASSSGTMSMHFNPPMDVCQKQNTGSSIDLVGGSWYYAEAHYKLNTPGQSDGVFELWVDNCGPSGTSCPATPTLRIKRTDVRTDRSNTGEKITTLWFEAWAEAFSVGERLIDQIKVSKVGPIGFMR